MHLAWSTVSYPTLYAAYIEGTESCGCNASTYNSTGNFTIPGLKSEFSMAVVFKGIFEFNATKKNFASEALNLTVACNPDVYVNNDSSYLSLNDERLEWNFCPENETFIGTYSLQGNYTYKNRTRFSIRVSVGICCHSVQYYRVCSPHHSNSVLIPFGIP